MPWSTYASTLDALPDALSRYTISRSVDELLSGSQVALPRADARGRHRGSSPGAGQVRHRRRAVLHQGGAPAVRRRRGAARADRVHRSLVCGHFKSTLYSEYLAWSVGIQPADVRRHRLSPQGARAAAEPVLRTGLAARRRRRRARRRAHPDGRLGHRDLQARRLRLLRRHRRRDRRRQPRRCLARSVHGRLAGRQRRRRPIRSSAARLFDEGEANGELDVIAWTAEDVAAAQAGAVRHRRPGLAVRLGNRARQGVWAPTKRVAPLPESELDSPFAQRMLNREAIAHRLCR